MQNKILIYKFVCEHILSNRFPVYDETILPNEKINVKNQLTEISTAAAKWIF